MNVEGLRCVQCSQPFTENNVYSPEGWREVEISGMCEKCFDGLFEDEDDEINED